jgi:hypothetical protein
LRFYKKQAQVQNRPDQLFSEHPQLFFKPEQKICPIDNKPLQVLKTQKRTIKTIGVGTVQAHHSILYCKRHPGIGTFRAKELDELVAPNSTVAYAVMVEIGKLRFLQKRQIKEIQSILLEHHSIGLSISEIELLVDKFVFYLAFVHQESVELIREQIRHQGGYILHVDATCESDSPKLLSSLDSVSGFVLHSAKLNSENKDEVGTFLKQIKQDYGIPVAIISDMSKGIATAIEDVFENLLHFICHFHFLKAIGKLLFDKENDVLRKALSKAGISGKLKEIRRKLNKTFNTLSIDAIETYLAEPQQLGQTREASELLAYYLVLWVLDHAAEGNGYGFPFDQRYLHFYQRLEAAHTLIAQIKPYYPALSENDRIIWQLYHLTDKIVSDAALKTTVNSYQSKLSVFSELRKALRIAQEQVHNGLTQTNEISSLQELQKIKSAVQNFLLNLKLKIQNTTDLKIKHSFKNVKERIEQYWHKLFAEPLVVNVNGQEKLLFVHRTNNFVENHFRQLNYSYRRIHGNHSVRRNLENIPAALPLTENLKNPNYVKLIFKDESEIAKRFSQIDVKKIRKMSDEHRKKRQSFCSRKMKRIIRQPKFKILIRTAFAHVAN